jgi:hypothetical protein
MQALQTQDDRLTKLHQSVGKLQQRMESAAGRFSRLDKAVAELAQRTGQLDKELSAVKGRAEVSFGALAAKVDQSGGDRPDAGRGPAAAAHAADPGAAGGQRGGRPRGQQGRQQGGQPHLTPQGVGLGGYRERYVPGVLGAGVRGKAGRG